MQALMCIVAAAFVLLSAMPANADTLEARLAACLACHGSTGQSVIPEVPSLGGQREDYLAKAMREFKNNTRRGYDASMADVLFPVGDDQILDLAYFLAGLR